MHPVVTVKNNSVAIPYIPRSAPENYAWQGRAPIRLKTLVEDGPSSSIPAIPPPVVPSRRKIAAKHFGRQLLALRKSAGLSQSALAKKVGLSINYLGLLENGKRQPSLLTVLLIQKALGLALQDLITDAVSEAILKLSF